MKKYLLILLLLLISGKGFSQETKAQIQVEKGDDFKKAEFPGGEEAFRKEFMNMVYAYIDVALYAI